MTPASTLSLSTEPLAHPAMDYDLLRKEGISHLEKLAAKSWSDFNAHDPGITILEQVCYAITDLGYRMDYDIPDLLASEDGNEDPYGSLYSPAKILTCRPVTVTDLRKIIIDVPGVGNAWVEIVQQPVPALYYHPGSGELTLEIIPLVTEPVVLKGLYRVLIEKSDLADLNSASVREAVARRLHANRAVGEDFAEIRVLDAQDVRVSADIAIGPVDDPRQVLVEIYQRLAAHISPSVPFHTLQEMRSVGKSVDEIFDGPVLEHGFIDTETLQRTRRHTALRASDLLREIMDVPGVRAVRNIAMATGDRWEVWSLDLDPARAPRFDPQNSAIRLEKDLIDVTPDKEATLAIYRDGIDKASGKPELTTDQRDIRPARGRDRHLSEYDSLQRQFPAVYGIGELGLPASAAPTRRARARQLKAYLLFFDQLLANGFAQLAHVRDLFSFQGDNTRTYFSQVVDDPGLGLAALRVREDLDDHAASIQRITANPSLDPARKNRLLDHLLARFAERFTDYALVLRGLPTGELSAEEKLIGDKQAFLQDYPRIGAARGGAFDYTAWASEAAVSGLQRRIELALGIPSGGAEPALAGDDKEGLYLVEHILLRPMAGDKEQQGPLLADARYKDPYSLQVSFVFPDWPGRFPSLVFRQFVERTLREETPAHLTPYVQWLDRDAMAQFETAWRDWRKNVMGAATEHDVAVRGTRDRLLDLLGIGQLCPLRDLPVRGGGQLMVPFNSQAKIPIGYSQREVVYALCDDKGVALKDAEGNPFQVTGNGAEVLLTTPEVTEDIVFTIRARYPASSEEGALLHQAVTVKVGLDTGLDARIEGASLLDTSIDTTTNTDARIVDFGAGVQVTVQYSQEGVDYRLVYLDDGGADVVLSDGDDVRGTGGDIPLSSVALPEDRDIRIRATKTFDSERADETALLDIVLPLKVRANPNLDVSADSAIIDYGAGATIRIADTQASASYQLYTRAIPDSGFVYGTPLPGTAVLEVPVTGEPNVQVMEPASGGSPWEAPAGYVPVGSPQSGNGGELILNTGALTDDTLVILRAEKAHSTKGATIPSVLQLTEALTVLVKPDATRTLALEEMEGGAMQVSGGQPGVFYHFRLEAGGDDIGLPVYFHKQDPDDETKNKGVSQTRIGVDLVIARDATPEEADLAVDLARPSLQTPLLEAGELPVDTSVLYARAIKARTRVAAEGELIITK
uniref:Baseplate J-like protein n=1 Tax=Candidatus Kentrum sp. DK TaxID=2126562 RepID=A0A450T228_9GAMM|nr:MAG: hypothetical protein BECKDK2373C_GA0170839_10829 [Candidatus Kentron sp. DK]